MKREVAEKWITALRSKEYHQTAGSLHTHEGLCCLGVLCEVAIKEGVALKKHQEFWDNDETKYRYVYGQYWHGSLLPQDIVDWAGMNSNEGTISGDYALITYNDGDAEKDIPAMSFEQIADLIERNIDNL